MKIKFLSSGPIQTRKAASPSDENEVYINPAYFYLRHYYNLHGKNKNVQWLMPEFLIIGPSEDLIESIVDEQPDIVGFGIYVWNREFQLHVASCLKKRLPNTTIVIGGPELDAHKTKGFFDQHPYVDFVVYGDGERAFQQIIDYKSGLIDQDEFVNIVGLFDGVEKVFTHELLYDEEYFNTSSFVPYESHIKQCYEYTANKLKKYYPTNGNWIIVAGIEFARGCMYSCTFCDWSQNLSKKVKRRKHSWKDEIDLFHRLDVRLSETDANFGMWKDDIKAYDYARSLYDPNRKFNFIVQNTPKLQKDITEYIIYNNIKTYNCKSSVISFQDINETVLENINRPSVSWEAHKKLISNLKNKLTEEEFNSISSQLILGLPGQTVKSLIDTIADIASAGPIVFIMQHWVLLANSPAADLFYQKLHKLKFMPAAEMFEVNSNNAVIDLETVYSSFANKKQLPNILSAGLYVWSTSTMDFFDMVKIKIMLKLWRQLPNKLKINKSKDEILQILNRLEIIADKEVTNQKSIHMPLIEKYGVVVNGHYDIYNGKLYDEW